jgi:hypothetical protein
MVVVLEYVECILCEIYVIDRISKQTHRNKIQKIKNTCAQKADSFLCMVVLTNFMKTCIM